MNQVLIETINLKKYFKTPLGDLHAVDGMSIKINKSETLGIVGESGCGKSTLGRAILRLLEPTGGQVLFEGKDILDYNKKRMKEIRKEAQMIFQDPYSSINPRFTVSDIIAEPIKINKLSSSKKEIRSKVSKLMEIVGLSKRLEHAYPHELDGGRRQRIGVARALSVNPKFIVCDEPVSALDVSIQAQILNLLMDLQDEMEIAFMFITHDLSVVKHISNQIAVMYLGQCVEITSSDKLFRNAKHPYTKALLSAIPTIDLSNRNKKRILIQGEISSPINPEPGCRFEPRCKYATEACVGKNIELREVDNNHSVACVLYE